MKKYDIYLIWSKDCDGNILRYYGSTCNFIKRKSNHKLDYQKWVKNGRPNKKCSSFIILDNGDWKMEKIDEIEGDRWEARKLEGEYQKNNDCVNIRIECRTKKEYKLANKDKLLEQSKEYRLANKDKLLEQSKEYRLANKDIILEKKKEFYNKNKEVILEQKKEFYNKNKEVILEQKKEYRNKNKAELAQKSKVKITCECGAEVSKSSLFYHRKTNKHINFINSANND